MESKIYWKEGIVSNQIPIQKTMAFCITSRTLKQLFPYW